VVEKAIHYREALLLIQEVVENIEEKEICYTVPRTVRSGEKIKINLLSLEQVKEIIDEALNG
jgi:hypothetical protein